jgi:outer membrane usher protein FimD/PapC
MPPKVKVSHVERCFEAGGGGAVVLVVEERKGHTAVVSVPPAVNPPMARPPLWSWLFAVGACHTR